MTTQQLQKHYIDLYELHKGKIPGLKLVTPDLAQKYSEKNTDNYRIKSESVIRKFCADILNGSFDVTGEAIKFLVDGVLGDGQHRIDAIIRTGVAVPVVVLHNIPNSAVSVMDGGSLRKLHDEFRRIGEEHPKVLSCVTNLAYGLDKTTNKHTTPTRSQLANYLNNHPEIRNSVSKFYKNYSCSPITSTVASYVHYRLSLVHPSDADHFTERLIIGCSLKKNDPVWMLRNYITDQKKKGALFDNKTLVGFIFKTWNMERKNQKLTRTKLIKDVNIIPDPK